MRQTQQYRYISSSGAASGGGSGGGPGGFVGRVVAFIVGLGVFAVALFLGAIFIAAVLGFMLLAGLLVSGRVWWLKRKMERERERYEREHGDLEADYIEVTRTGPRKQPDGLDKRHDDR